MTAARKALEALEAAGKDGTPRPWRNAGGYLTVRDPDGGSFSASIYHLDEMGQASRSAPFQAVPFSRTEDARLIALSVNLSAPLAAVVRAAMEYREDGYLGADGMQHHTPEACAAFHAALDAFNAAAQAQGFAP